MDFCRHSLSAGLNSPAVNTLMKFTHTMWARTLTLRSTLREMICQCALSAKNKYKSEMRRPRAMDLCQRIRNIAIPSAHTLCVMDFMKRAMDLCQRIQNKANASAHACAMDFVMNRCILLTDNLWAMDLCRSKQCNLPLAVRTPWALDSCQRTPSAGLNMDLCQCMQYNLRPALRIPWAMDVCRRTPRAGLDSQP